MSSLNIRLATLDDAAAIADLSTQLGYPASAADAATRLSILSDSNEHAVWVACLADGLAIGWIHAFTAHRVESDVFAELGGFVVADGHRGRGIGKALLAAAEEWVMARGIPKLRVRTRSGRVEAHFFYERLGFELMKEQRVYDKDLSATV